MLDKFLVLLERFVVAHELIAANSVKSEKTPVITVGPITEEVVAELERTSGRASGGVLKTDAPEDDLADDEPEEKPKRKPRQAKPKEEPKGPDVAKLREEIKTIAKAIAAGDSDECADKFDELLEDYKVRTVTKLADEDVEAFHKDATKLVGKYYEIED